MPPPSPSHSPPPSPSPPPPESSPPYPVPPQPPSPPHPPSPPPSPPHPPSPSHPPSHPPPPPSSPPFYPSPTPEIDSNYPNIVFEILLYQTTISNSLDSNNIFQSVLSYDLYKSKKLDKLLAIVLKHSIKKTSSNYIVYIGSFFVIVFFLN